MLAEIAVERHERLGGLLRCFHRKAALGVGQHLVRWGRVGQGRALESCRPGAAAAHAGLSRGFVGVIPVLVWRLGFCLAAVEVKTPVFFWELTRINFLTIREKQ